MSPRWLHAFPSHLAGTAQTTVESVLCWACSARLLHPLGNTLNARCKRCFLATGQSRKKSGLPVCMGTSRKQLAQKVYVNVSSLALTALAIDRVKQSFPSPRFFLGLVQMLSRSTLLQAVYILMCPFTFPTYEASKTFQWKAGVGTQCARTHSLCFKEQPALSGAAVRHKPGEGKAMQRLRAESFTSPARDTQPPPCHGASACSRRVQLGHQSQREEKGMVGASPSQRDTFSL